MATEGGQKRRWTEIITRSIRTSKQACRNVCDCHYRLHITTPRECVVEFEDEVLLLDDLSLKIDF